MTDNISSEESESDGERTQGPPPAKKFKQKTLQFGPATRSLDDSTAARAREEPSSENASELCTSECCKGGLTPYQPTESSKLQLLQRKQGKRIRRFSPTWYTTYSWLTVCTTRAKAFCVYCRYCSAKGLLHLAKKGEDAFIDIGFDNWKKAHEKFVQHLQSDLHKEAVLKIELSQQEDVYSLLNSQAMADQKVRQQMLLMQLSSLKYLLRQGLAIRGHQEIEGNLLQLLSLRSSDCSQLNAWIKERKYLSPQIVNEQISLMGLNVLRRLLAEIHKAHWFSLIVDEASDVSNKEQMVVCIRWIDEEFCIHEDPVELIHLPKTDAETLSSALKDCLIRFSLPISQCRGQAYDGASSMSGHLSGLAARITNDVPTAIFVHCFAHCTNLCLQTVGRQCVPVRDALDLAMEISQLILYSPKRSSLFSTLQSQMSPGSKTLKPLCPIRWTVRTAAISAILSNYTVLCTALEEINAHTHDDYGRKAGGFLALMENFSTFFSLKLSHLVFSGTEQLSLTLQGKDTTIQEGTMAAELAIQYLGRLRSDVSFEQFYTKVVQDSKDITSPPVLPRYRQPPRRPGSEGAVGHAFPTPESYFKKQYFEVLDLLISELKRQFQQKRGLPIAAMMEKLLMTAANNTSIDLGELPEEMQLYKNDIDLQKLKHQLQMLPDLIRTRNVNVPNCIPIKSVTNVRTICDIMNEINMSKEMLSEVLKLLKIYYTIPVTTSSAERTFSALRRLKTYLRSTMTQPRLNNMMLLYIHKEKTDQIDDVPIAKSFIMENERRRHYFGSI